MQIRLHDFRQSKKSQSKEKTTDIFSANITPLHECALTYKSTISKDIRVLQTAVPRLPDVLIQDLKTLVWFGDVDLTVRVELRAVVRSGKHTGVAIMDQIWHISHSLQHSGLNLCKTHNYFNLHSLHI